MSRIVGTLTRWLEPAATLREGFQLALLLYFDLELRVGMIVTPIPIRLLIPGV
jgi:hypothetical protein